MMRLASVTLMIALLLAVPAKAADCDDAGTVIEQIDCAEKVLVKADAELNRVWKRVMAEHPSGGDPDHHRGEIRAAQRLWIQFRDADCQALSKTGIPKYWGINELNCLIDTTRSRTKHLTEAYLF